MLYKEDELFKLAPLVANYEQHGETHEKHILKASEIRPYEEMGHISNLEITEAEYEEEQVKRLDEINYFKGLTLEVAEKYVLDGEVDKGSILELAKESESLEGTILEISKLLGEVLT